MSKILFLCASVERGRDGVGDYTMRLAHRLQQCGVEAFILALNDRWISQTVTDDGGEITILRLPAALNHRERSKQARLWITQCQPDWISLQYVGFGYSPRGLPWYLVKILRHRVFGQRLHIMFHELWCGMGVLASKRERILGAMQKYFIHRMLIKLAPESIFTSIQPYRRKLQRLGVSVEQVPIFGNIPIFASGKNNRHTTLNRNDNWLVLKEKRNQCIVLGIFGTPYAFPGLGDVVKLLQAAATNTGKELVLFFVGHGRSEEVRRLKDGHQGLTVETGFLDESETDCALQEADFGLCSSPCDGIDKSGGAIAWMERGIPLLVSAEDDTYDAKSMKVRGIYQLSSWQDVNDALVSRGTFMSGERVDIVAKRYGVVFS